MVRATTAPRLSAAALLALPLVAAIGYGLAAQPMLAAGAAIGTLLLAVTLSWPLAIVAAMLALGPVNLSFLTGGSKQLLPALGGLDMSGIRLVGITLGLGLVILGRRDLMKGLAAPGSRWYLLFLLWACATLPMSPAHLDGVRLLLKLGYPFLLFTVIAAPERRPEELHRLGDFALWGALALLLVNPVLLVTGSATIESGEWVRVSFAGSHYNPFSFYLLAILVICLGRFRARGQSRYLWMGVVAAVWIAFTLTRITFLASFVAIAVVTLYTAVADRNWRALAAAGAFAALLAGLALRGVLVRTFGYVPSPGQMLALLSDPVGLFQAINWEGRETLWAALLVQIWKSPIVGSGMGASTSVLAHLIEGVDVAHNEYLRIAVDTGVIGCVLYFLAVSGWIRAALRTVARRGALTEEYAMPALALIGAWAVIAATDNAFDYYGPFTQYVAFLAAGCVALNRADAAAEAQLGAAEAAAAPLLTAPAIALAPSEPAP